ncbi:hypothetical protein CEXT_6961 [Caerostris extrusa]|uniref:Ribosomal protein S10 n=1 Tax=Caerostris extrusa TaxID=172846 RepID=A0AAV4UMP6_CAEEX|nr:hypothetical protein CEXT_6961 [Caerostris extrusa]
MKFFSDLKYISFRTGLHYSQILYQYVSVLSEILFAEARRKRKEKRKNLSIFLSHTTPKCRRVHRSSSLQFRENGGIHFLLLSFDIEKDKSLIFRFLINVDEPRERRETAKPELQNV